MQGDPSPSVDGEAAASFTGGGGGGSGSQPYQALGLNQRARVVSKGRNMMAPIDRWA
jgi:hypothetical protein